MLSVENAVNLVVANDGVVDGWGVRDRKAADEEGGGRVKVVFIRGDEKKTVGGTCRRWRWEMKRRRR